jgi:hypothetical protein
MIEQVEKLAAELQVSCLAEFELLECAQVDVLQPVLAQGVSAEIAKGVRNDGNSIRVEPAIRCLLNAGGQQITDESWPLRSASDICIVERYGDCKWESAIQRDNTRCLPASKYVAREEWVIV